MKSSSDFEYKIRMRKVDGTVPYYVVEVDDTSDSPVLILRTVDKHKADALYIKLNNNIKQYYFKLFANKIQDLSRECIYHPITDTFKLGTL